MESPCPGFGDRATGHGVEGAGLTKGAQVHVNEDPEEHDERGNVVQDVADGYRDATKGAGPNPQDYSRNQEHYRADRNLPELHLLTGVEEPGFRGLKLFWF